jgi:hypothetical protein
MDAYNCFWLTDQPLTFSPILKKHFKAESLAVSYIDKGPSLVSKYLFAFFA